MAEIHLITFDLDNTLWDVGRVIRHAEAEMYAWLDERLPDYQQTMTRDVLLDIRRQAVADDERLSHDVSALRTEVLYRGMMKTGMNSAEARKLAEGAFAVFFDARQQVVFFDHALETLTELAGSYQLAALTNGNAHVRKMGLDRYFNFAYSSADVSASKPAPDIFHAALDRAGVEAHEAIHVGDHLLDDIHGAGSVGMHTIWVKHPAQDASVTHTQPTQTIERLRDLTAAVRRIQDG